MALSRAKRTSTLSPKLSLPKVSRYGASGVSVHALDDVPWRDLGRAGVKDKAVRRDAATGHYLGLIAFEPMSRSGLHQHLGTALSYFLAGSLCDYQGSAREGMAGINLAGATHDAVTYTGALLASRLEGPVAVPEGVSVAHPIRGGARDGKLVNPFPERWPDINVVVDAVPLVPTRFQGIGRRLIFDYAPTGDHRRHAAITIMPEAPAIEIAHEGLTDLFVLAGDVKIGGKTVFANSFVVIEPGARIEITSDYGCQFLAWAEGPGTGEAGAGMAELYGF